MSKVPVQRVASTEERKLPIFAEVEDVLKRVSDRAFTLFANRGFKTGMELDDWFRAEREICWPAAELSEEETEFVLKVELPGFDPDDITVTANPRELIVKAMREFERKEEPERAQREAIRWSEFRSDDVCRRVVIPSDIDVDEVRAEYKRGLLTVMAPKLARKKGRKVDISSAA